MSVGLVSKVEDSLEHGSEWTVRGRRAIAAAILTGGGMSLGGCGAVAGPEYTGEIGLELRGEVVSLGDSVGERVPVLAFIGDGVVHFVDGEVTGEFPSQFAIRFDQEPPPEAQSLELNTPGAPERIGHAALVMVAKDHPRVGLAVEEGPSGQKLDTDPDPETGKFERVTKMCSSDEKFCLTSTYSCRSEPCESILNEEVSLADEKPFRDSGTNHAYGDEILSYRQWCDSEACRKTMYLCDDAGPHDEVRRGGMIDHCTLVNREGKDPHDLATAQHFANELTVIYAPSPGEVLGVHVEQGYNVLRRLPEIDTDEWLASSMCRIDALNSLDPESPDYASKQHESALKACPDAVRYERLENPSAYELKIDFSGTPR